MKYSVILSYFLLFSVFSFAETPILPLEQARAVLKLPDYTAGERTLLAQQALMMLRELYVHRELKIEHFGRAVDPVPRLERLVSEAKEISNEAFHDRIRQIFLDLRDLHTNYLAPAPLKCGTLFIPVRFESVMGDEGAELRASQKIKYKSELADGISIGDRLLEVDGRPVEEEIRALSRYSGGANPDALRNRSVQMLSLRSPSLQPLPKNDSVTLKLEGTNGIYKKEISWQAILNSKCLQGGREGHRLPYSDRLDVAIDEYQREFNTIFRLPRKNRSWSSGTKFADELSEVFEAEQIITPAGNLGYIRLKEFYWSHPGLDEGTIIEAFRRAVDEELKDSIGMVIDVRGNPGGLITLAENLVQLFSRQEFVPSTVRMLANPLNREIFLRANGQENRWSQSVSDALSSDKLYAGPLGITPPSEANEIGQIWFHPTVVLTDANCYSACDLFVAGMKDNSAATIIGLHGSTGAGGANVMEYNTFRAIMAESENNPFLALPHSQNMRVSWRQVIRSGKAQGKLIEAFGVESDVVVPLVPADIGGESRELMKKIHRIVDDLQPKYVAAIGYRPGGLVLLRNGEGAQWTEGVRGIDALEVFADGKKVAAFSPSFSDTLKSFVVKVPALVGSWADKPVSVIGKRGGETVFRVMRDLLWRGDYLPLPEEGVVMDFADEDFGWVRPVLLHGPEKTAGWQISDGKLRVGRGPKYDGAVHARAILPVGLEGKGARLSFDISLEAEDPHDSLRIYVINPDSGERRHLFAGSHLPASQGASVNLPKGWERADIVFEFESDENWNMAGPLLDNLKVAP